MKYKITKFTEKEKKEIKKTYKEFDEIENEVWVEDAIESHMTPYIREYLKFYPFVKKLSSPDQSTSPFTLLVASTT